jgi:hypothetical protein
MQAEHPDKVFFFGPDFGSHSDIYFAEDKNLLKEWKKPDLAIRVGRWKVPGEPIAILLKFDALWPQKDAIYAWAWDKFKVQSHAAYGDYDESCLFGYAAGMVMESLYGFIVESRKSKVESGVSGQEDYDPEDRVPKGNFTKWYGVVDSCIFKGVHYEMTVKTDNGYEFMVQDYHEFLP